MTGLTSRQPSQRVSGEPSILNVSHFFAKPTRIRFWLIFRISFRELLLSLLLVPCRCGNLVASDAGATLVSMLVLV
jgi:hypothetical protein